VSTDVVQIPQALFLLVLQQSGKGIANGVYVSRDQKGCATPLINPAAVSTVLWTSNYHQI
jgi:hypothetical protein